MCSLSKIYGEWPDMSKHSDEKRKKSIQAKLKQLTSSTLLGVKIVSKCFHLQSRPSSSRNSLIAGM